MRVLLVEDDPTTSKSIEMMLTHANLNVYTTDMGEEGIDLAKLYDYDLILLDLGLPDMNGHEVLALCDDVWLGRDPRDWRETVSNIIAEFALVSIDLSETQTVLSECNYLITKEGRGGREIQTRHPLMDAAQHLTTRRMSLARSLALTGAAATPRNVRQRSVEMAEARRGNNIASSLLG